MARPKDPGSTPPWTSGVTQSNPNSYVHPGVTVSNSTHTSSTYPNSYYHQNIPAGLPGSSMPSPYVTTLQQPTDGMIANIAGKVYRYSEAVNEWHEVIDSPLSETTEALVLPVELDARGMLAAFKQYREFLEELDGLDQKHADVVSDTLFGLDEAIEALERLDQT